MSLNDRLVRLARMMAETYTIQGDIIRNDPQEAARFSICQEGAKRLTAMADQWEDRMFIGFDPAGGKDGTLTLVQRSVDPVSGWRSASFTFAPNSLFVTFEPEHRKRSVCEAIKP